MDGLVEDFCFECHSSSMTEHCANMKYKLVELVPLYMKIGISFIKMLVCHAFRLLKILECIFK